MNDRRVVVTGCGALSCVGNDVDTFWKNVVEGNCGLGPLTKFEPTDSRTTIAGELKDFDITKYMSKKEAKRLDEFSQYAIVAANEALANAGLNPDLREEADIDVERVGVVIGSGIGGQATTEKQAVTIYAKGPRKASALLIPKMIIDLAAGNVSMQSGAKGPNMAIVTACASASHSIGEAFWMIKRDDADMMITGGTEAAITKVAMSGFAAMKAMSTRNDDPLKASRPFDKDRDGFVMAEGAGIVVLEEYEHAKKRGANILAEVVGYGATGDAYHITSPAPNGEGAARAIRIALKHAGLEPKDIDYINAHGTSTPLNDKFETEAIKGALGEEAYNVSISSIKGTIGHGLGAAGGLETIACIKAINTGIIPPSINNETPDPELDLDYTPNVAKERDVNVAVNINLGFGGHNGVLILKKFEE